ncbi:MAG: alkaline phosphatase [Deltaproteobacteria bacterium]
MILKRQARSLMMAIAMLLVASAACAAPAKYVFFFLGDGMSSSQIQATEAYLTTINGGSAMLAADLLRPENRLNMSKMEVSGMQTTYDSHTLITDSASAATAFACGLKTRSGVIGMDDTKSISYKSIAQLAHEAGKRVGIISSVSIDHATPAAYYASVPSRSYMNSIGTQMAASGYEFFGGGGLVKPTAELSGDGDTDNDVWALLEQNGYKVLDTKAEILAQKANPRDKVVCINEFLPDKSKSMPYAIDRPETNLTLAEMTEVAITTLMSGNGSARSNRSRFFNFNRNDGFFLMVEGGKIDWACHANDAMAVIGDMLDFDAAIGVALDFYNKHPHETLIVVTGDHETGGMTIGHATTKYKAYYEKLLGQRHSYEYFDANMWAPHEEANEAAVCANWQAPNNLESDATMMGWLQSEFGIDYSTLNDYQKQKLEDAYDKSMCEVNDNSDSENTLLYGRYNPITVTITHILNELASIGWTSYSHTGVPVPVFAQGRYAYLFAGFYDNTDIAKKLAKAMNLPTLPVQK